MPDTPGPAGSRHRPSILVTGATGNVGREVVDRLVALDTHVRCLVRRSPGPRPDVDWLVGDLTDPADVRAALHGMDAVFLIWPLLDASPARKILAELVRTSPRVVYLSSTAIDDSAPQQSDPIVQVHAEVEALLDEAGLDPIVLRSDTLASNARGWVAQLRVTDEVAGPDVPRTPVVDERDVARAVAAALLTPRAHLDDGPYLLTGPEALTRAEQVGRLGAALQRPLRFRPLPVDQARARMLTDGRPQPLVEALIAASTQRPASTRITDHLQRLTGRPATTFATWAIEHAAEFPAPAPSRATPTARGGGPARRR
ncbi:NAD(P)H-binding protein [Nocardioides luteus]|nr:NAD(P)H-binding protein [Nocardioides luteus]